MPILATRKHRVAAAAAAAAAAGSKVAEADSAWTSAWTGACAYLSAVVVTGLVPNAAFGWWWADPIAALGAR